jgi:predicted nuclease of predicted toxin-antitoxin system
MDVNVRIEITLGLRKRGIDCLTAQEDQSARLRDSDLLDRANALNRVLFTHDDDFKRLCAMRQASGMGFAGVVYAHQLKITIGRCIDDLELIAKVYEPAEITNQLLHLPL